MADEIPFAVTIQASVFVAACAGGHGTYGYAPLAVRVTLWEAPEL